jgi:hypothetical protein
MKENASGVVEEEFAHGIGLGTAFGDIESYLLQLDGRQGEKYFVYENEDEHLNFKKAKINETKTKADPFVYHVGQRLNCMHNLGISLDKGKVRLVSVMIGKEVDSIKLAIYHRTGHLRDKMYRLCSGIGLSGIV